MSGVTFGAPGLGFPDLGAPKNGQSFINYVDYGDPIGSYGNHYGTVQFVGSQATRALSIAEDALLTSAIHGGRSPVSTIIGVALVGGPYHDLGHYGADLHLV